MLNDIGRAINNLIEGEAAMKRAVGRLWQAAYASENEDENGMAPANIASGSAQGYGSMPNGDAYGKIAGQENGDSRFGMMEDGEEVGMDVHMEGDEMPPEKVPESQKLPQYLSVSYMAAIK